MGKVTIGIEKITKEKLSELKMKEKHEKDNLELTDWNTVRDLDVIITSSSRPEILEITMQRMEEYLHFHGNFRFILNEDFVIPKESEKLVKWARQSGYFKEEDIIVNKRPLGLEQALVTLIKRVKTPFCLHMQDDWAFERPIELDKALYMMEHLKKINNILFYKSVVPVVKDKILLREYDFTQIPQHLTLNYSWELMPGLWRTDFIKPIILKAMHPDNEDMRKFRTAPAKLTNYLRPKDKRADMDHLYNNMGVFFWGRWGEPRWCRHIGEEARMENWRMNADGTPGSENNPQEYPAVVNMARWIPFEYIPPKKGRNSINILKNILREKGMKIK